LREHSSSTAITPSAPSHHKRIFYIFFYFFLTSVSETKVVNHTRKMYLLEKTWKLFCHVLILFRLRSIVLWRIAVFYNVCTKRIAMCSLSKSIN
jgi:hypothetical protein